MKYIFYIFIAVLAVVALRIVIPQAQSAPVVETISKEELTKTVNEWSMKEKGYEYKELPELCDVAALRLNQVKREFSHEGFVRNSKEYHTIIKSIDLGENLAEGITTEHGVMEAWLNSVTHKEVLTKKYPYMCIETDGNYVVQLFAIL